MDDEPNQKFGTCEKIEDCKDYDSESIDGKIQKEIIKEQESFLNQLQKNNHRAFESPEESLISSEDNDDNSLITYLGDNTSKISHRSNNTKGFCFGKSKRSKSQVICDRTKNNENEKVKKTKTKKETKINRVKSLRGSIVASKKNPVNNTNKSKKINKHQSVSKINTLNQKKNINRTQINSSKIFDNLNSNKPKNKSKRVPNEIRNKNQSTAKIMKEKSKIRATSNPRKSSSNLRKTNTVSRPKYPAQNAIKNAKNKLNKSKNNNLNIKKNLKSRENSNSKNKKSNINSKRKYSDDSLDKDDLFSRLNQYTNYNNEMQKLKSINDKDLSNNLDEDLNEKKMILRDSTLYNTNSIAEKSLLNNNMKEKKKKIQPKIDTGLRKFNKNFDTYQNNKENFEPGSCSRNNAEVFLADKIKKFKKKKKFNLDRLMNPKHKKKTTEIKNECTFQPMLSRRSLTIASKSVSKKINQKRYSRSPTPKAKAIQEYKEFQSNTPTFKPKINSKSKYLDSKNHKNIKNRINRLEKAGNDYKQRREQRLKEKMLKEEEELRGLSFRPRNSNSKHLSNSKVNLSIAERSARWAERRKERVMRKKQEYDSIQEEKCSFRPKINKNSNISQNAPSELYSSRFVQDGLKDYFTRLEQARKIKMEKKMRLENWGRDKSQKTKKGILSSINVSYISHVSDYDSGSNDFYRTPTKNSNQRPMNNQNMGHTIEILRQNLQEITIDL